MLIYIHNEQVQREIEEVFSRKVPLYSIYDTDKDFHNSPLWFEMYGSGEEVIRDYFTNEKTSIKRLKEEGVKRRSKSNHPKYFGYFLLGSFFLIVLYKITDRQETELEKLKDLIFLSTCIILIALSKIKKN